MAEGSSSGLVEEMLLVEEEAETTAYSAVEGDQAKLEVAEGTLLTLVVMMAAVGMLDCVSHGVGAVW